MPKEIISQTKDFQPFKKEPRVLAMPTIPNTGGAQPQTKKLPDGRIALKAHKRAQEQAEAAVRKQMDEGVPFKIPSMNDMRQPKEGSHLHQHLHTETSGYIAPVTSAPSESDYAEHHHIHLENVPEAGASAFISAPEGVSAALPSRFAFYPFKDLFIHPIRGKHLAKLARAHAEKSMLIMVETISDVLSTSDSAWNGTPLAFSLTVPDFYWVLYFQRRNSFTKSSFTHTSRCTNPIHIKQVQDGKKSLDSLKITEVVTRSMLSNVELEEVPVVDTDFMGGLDLRPSTMGDMITIMEDPRFGKDPEFEYSSQIACYIAGDYTFAQKLELFDQLSPDQIDAIKTYEKSVSDYGIQEKINVRCKDCGALRETNVSINASTFLSVV